MKIAEMPDEIKRKAQKDARLKEELLHTREQKTRFLREVPLAEVSCVRNGCNCSWRRTLCNNATQLKRWRRKFSDAGSGR